MKDYLKSLNEQEAYPELAKYALEHKVPIINEESLIVIKSYLNMIKPKHILEIGTAIGYSALQMASVNDEVLIDSLERNHEMFQLAHDFVKKYGKNNQIKLINEDALTIDLSKLKASYDVIFIDAGKAQYQKFFNRFESLLSVGGLIITDNILFHHLVGSTTQELSPNLRSLTAKIDKYNQWLKTLNNYQTFFLSTGDGLAISQKVK